MENPPYGYPSNEVSGDEIVKGFDKDVKVVESVGKSDSVPEVSFDFSISGNVQESFGLGSFGVIDSSAVNSIVENNDLDAHKRFMLWHSLSSPDYIGIFSSLGVSDTTCLIHAESLIVYICCLAQKQGHNLLDFSTGPHTLQFVYRVDRFLRSFSRSGGAYKLVFFKVFRNLFDPNFALSEEDEPFFDSYLYYRELLKCHLKHRGECFLEFEDWLCEPFLAYLAENEPSCILLEDGSSFVYVFDTVYELLDSHAKGRENVENKVKYLEYLSNQARVDRYCNLVYTLISQSLLNSLSVVYLFDITRQSHDFMAFISFSSSTHVPTSLHQQCCGLVSRYRGADEVNDGEFLLELYGEVVKVLNRKVNIRDLVACNYLKEFTKLSEASGEDEVQSQLFLLTFKCLVLHNYICDNFSLRERCTKRVETSNWDFYTEDVAATVDFMTFCTYPIFNSLNSLTQGDLAGLESLDCSVEDLFDSNLFSTILCLACEYGENHGDQVDNAFFSLDKNVVETLDSLYQHFGKSSSPFFPIQLGQLSYKKAESVNGNQPDAQDLAAGDKEVSDRGEGVAVVDEYLKQISSKYLFVNNSFINLYYKFEKSDLGWVKAKAVDELVMFEKHFWRDPCSVSERMECIDFHINFDLKEKQQELTKFSTRRSLQNQSNFSFLLSKYLGSSNLHHPIVIKLEHFWLHAKFLNLQNYASQLGLTCVKESVKSGVKGGGRGGKESKSPKNERGGKEKLSKVELLRLKNAELQESKKLESDSNTLNRLESKLSQLFNNDKSFEEMYNNILDHTDGPSRAVDLLNDFKWVKSILSTRNVQVLYVYKMLQRLYNCFCSYRLRIVKSAPNSFRRLLTMVLRLIFVYYSHYRDLLTREIVLLLYTFLHQLNFPNYSLNLVNSYNSYLTNKAEACEGGERVGRSEKKGRKGGKGVREDKRDEDLRNFVSQRDLEKTRRECDVWDFAIFEGSEFDFMLCYMGDLFERTLGSSNDPRVLFRPDAWQKMLLDIVDARESALVVAPTSTGKTYICYYAMEQVLRLDDQGMVIYVAPNTALALQVTYEITARFSSKYYTNPNLALSSTFLEKFHDPKWNSSQILVTVPTILEKLLVSMRSGEASFVSRLEYVIFDEVHCIADADLGAFLERCIHLIPCPFLALSATIGNPYQFHRWLCNVTEYKNELGRVHFIRFDERFSDLKLEIYAPNANFSGTKSGRSKLLVLNPVCCMAYKDVLNHGFPDDFYLTPHDAYTFVQAISLAVGGAALSSMEYLRPGSYFEHCTLITKRQYRYYLETLKVEFARLIRGGLVDSECYERILGHINLLSRGVNSGELDGRHRLYPLLQTEHIASQTEPVQCSVKECARDSQTEHIASETKPVQCSVKECAREGEGMEYLNEQMFYEMLKRLRESRRLPCLVFILDRNKMDHVLLGTTRLLLRLQWEKFFGTPERTLATKLANKARMDRYQMLLRQYEAEKKMRLSATKEQRELEGITSNVELEVPAEPVDVSQDYDPEFYFYNRKVYVNYTDEIEKFIGVAANSISGRKNASLFIEALKRGIGVHHEGLPHKFTMLTETLLRMGYLNVIISSKSLAFGINVPCKSVLFCGDNYELTPLMFKQMSGRCGRRGFDLSGHVIFWCISARRVKQLLLSKLPTLTTNTNNINLSILLTILSSFYTLVIKSNSQAGPSNLSLNKKSDDYLDIRDELILNSRKLLVEPKLLVQRLSSILNNTLNFYTHFFTPDLFTDKLDVSDKPGVLNNTDVANRSSVSNDTTNVTDKPGVLNNTGVTDKLGVSYKPGVLNKDYVSDNKMIILLVRIMLEILVSCGLLDENGLIRGCYELALLTRDIHPANILLAKLVQNSTLNSLLSNTGDVQEVDISLKLLEIVSLLVYKKREMGKVLNIRRLVSSRIRNGTNAPNVKGSFKTETSQACQVAYPDTFPLLPLNEKLQAQIHYYNRLVILTFNKYFNARTVNHDNTADDVFEGEFFRLYRRRNLYADKSQCQSGIEHVNIHGVLRTMDTFNELELNTHSFNLTSDLVPTIDDNFCKIVQLDEKFNKVKEFRTTFNNSYMCDYFTHGKFQVLRSANGLGQYAWSFLKKFIVFLQHFKFVLKTYTAHLNTDDPLYNYLRHLLDKIEPMFNKI